jgi:DNA-directed RNA polymerase sigma subunit (sigma70/sigma32)
MRRTTELQQRQATYHRAIKEADRARARFRAGIRAELKRGRTLEDIGAELGVTRQRVQQLASAS